MRKKNIPHTAQEQTGWHKETSLQLCELLPMLVGSACQEKHGVAKTRSLKLVRNTQIFKYWVLQNKRKLKLKMPNTVNCKKKKGQSNYKEWSETQMPCFQLSSSGGQGTLAATPFSEFLAMSCNTTQSLHTTQIKKTWNFQGRQDERRRIPHFVYKTVFTLVSRLCFSFQQFNVSNV